MNKIAIKLEIINELIKLIDKYPEQRFCQLIHNVTSELQHYTVSKDIFYITDENLLDVLKGE